MSEIEARADLIFTVVQTTLLAVMTSTGWHQYKRKACTIPLWTSLTSAVCLFILAVTQLSLGLEFASVTALLSGGLWLGLAGQRVAYGS